MNTLNDHLSARDIMTVEPVCVEPSMTIHQLAQVFEEHEISGAPVVDRQGRVIGVVSKPDLIRRCFESSPRIPHSVLVEALGRASDDDANVVPESLICVEDVMMPNPVTVGPTVSAIYVARQMFKHRVHRIVVVDRNKFPVGIITSLDLLGALAKP